MSSSQEFPPTILAWVMLRSKSFLFPEGSGWRFDSERLTAIFHSSSGRELASFTFECSWPGPLSSCIKGETISVCLTFSPNLNAQDLALIKDAREALERRILALETRLGKFNALLFPKGDDGLIDWRLSPFWKRSQEAAPATTNAYVTLGNLPCELACAFCTRSIKPYRSEPSDLFLYGLLYRFAHRMALGLGHTLDFGGDEPLHHPDLVSMIQFASLMGWNVELNTSAAEMLNLETIAKLKLVGLRRICMPIYGVTGPTHDSVVGVEGHFDATLLALEHAKAAGMPISLHTVITKLNVHEAIEIQNFAFTRYGETLGFLIPRAEGPSRLPFGDYMVRLSDFPKEIAQHFNHRVVCLGIGHEIGRKASTQKRLDRAQWVGPVGDAVTKSFSGQWTAVCERCKARGICDGPPMGYLDVYGDSEFKAQ